LSTLISYFFTDILRFGNRPSDEEVTIARMLDKVLRRSDAVDKESLCILAGERVNNLSIHREQSLIVELLLTLKVWALRLTIHCLADAGNLLDCTCLAGIVALKHFRRPEVEVIGDEVIVVSLILAVYFFIC